MKWLWVVLIMVSLGGCKQDTSRETMHHLFRNHISHAIILEKQREEVALLSYEMGYERRKKGLDYQEGIEIILDILDTPAKIKELNRLSSEEKKAFEGAK